MALSAAADKQRSGAESWGVPRWWAETVRNATLKYYYGPIGLWKRNKNTK